MIDKSAFKNILRKPAVQAVLLIFIISILAALITAYFESSHDSKISGFWDAVWWVLVTISTVGYGDKVPITPVGKLIAVVIMFFGVALLSVVTATISSIFVARKIKEGKGLQDIKLKNHILLCGWNTQAEQILSTFEKSGSKTTSVVMINQLPEEEAADVMSHHSDLKMRFVRGDFTQENVLTRANAASANAAIILPDISSGSMRPGDERTILATLSLKTLNPKTKVYAHILDKENLSHLRKAKADEILISNQHSGYLLANHVVAPGIPQFFEQLFSDTSPFSIQRREIPSELIGKTIADLRGQFNTVKKGRILGLGKVSEPFQISDLMGDDYSYLDEFIMQKFKEAGRGSTDESQVKIMIDPAPETELGKNDFYITLEGRQS